MRAEVSCLFHLEYDQNVVKEAHIGSGIYLQEVLDSDWLKDVLASDPSVTEDGIPLLKARQKLDWGPYTHRFYISLDEVTSSNDPRIEQAKQPVIRAIVLSRIIHATPIATGGTWIKTFFPESEEPYHLYEIGVGHYGSAYVDPQVRKTITQNDAARMAELWDPLQHLFDNEEKYKRIIRALKFFDGGYHIRILEFRHIVFFSALSALIFTGREHRKAQITQRLPQLVPEITEKQAVTIYNLFEDIMHTAAPMGSKAVRSEDLKRDEQVRPDDAEWVVDTQERLNAVRWLEKALRSLLERAISDRTFADLLAYRSEFDEQYPFEINASDIGRLIIRDAGVRGGRPVIAGTRIAVHRIATLYNQGLSPEEIAGRIAHLTFAQVYAALTHYHANRDEIDAEIAAEEAEADRLEQEHLLSLQSR